MQVCQVGLIFMLVLEKCYAFNLKTNMTALIFNLPPFILLLIMMTTFILGGLVMLCLVQKYVTWLHFADHTDFGEIFANSMSVIFGFILAFITITVWQNYNNVSDTVSKEANTLFNMYRTIEAYPPEVRDEGQKQLKIYVQEVVETEWPLLAKGQYDLRAYQDLKYFHDLIIHYVPKNNGELAAQQEELRLLSSYRELRRNRVESAKSLIDKPMWTALIFSAVLFLFFSSLFKMRNLRIHATMIALLGTSISLIFYLLILYNNPFIGPSALQSEPFERLLDYYWVGQKTLGITK